MSLEEHSTSWAVSLVDALESPDNKNVRLLALAGGTLVTISMWVVHLLYPQIFLFFLEQDNWAKLFIGFLLAPPFVLAFAAGCFIYPQAIEPATENESGPMSAYFYQERASKRWKLVIVAGLIAAVNLVLMFVASGAD
jgi:hypothetical protein